MIKPIETPDLLGATDQFFGPQTPLQRADQVGGRPYEPRPQQAEMARRIAAAFAEGKHLCVEAPTGVGKTFAYLVPAVLLSLEKKMPVVISTHTISLQEQIMERDFPVIRDLLGVECKAVLAKGRANYICRRRLLSAAGHHHEYLPGPEFVPELERLLAWAGQTTDGSRSALDYEPTPAIWEAICCEIGNCLGQACPHCRSCFFVEARRRLLQANLIVANHALFFTDMAMKDEGDNELAGIFPRFAAAILDEGHTIEDTAAVHLGVRVTSFAFRRLLHRLYNPERNRGLLVDVSCTPARLAVVKALEQGERFFKRFNDVIEEQNLDPLRIKNPGLFPNTLTGPLAAAREQVAALVQTEQDESRRQEMKALNEQLTMFRDSLELFLNLAEPDYVYWLERQGSRNRILCANAVPIEVAPLLRELLFRQPFTTIVTSATLAVKGRMDYFTRRIGAEEAETLILDSPFDFARQVTLHIPFDMPNPNDTEHFIPAACEHIRQFLLQTQGHAFVLFTSYKMMQDMAALLAEFFHKSGLHLLMQGEGLPRTKLLETFRQTPHAVLFGTDSFWTGVDVPGEALINVIIVKLPFAVPDNPIVEARQELIEKRGGRAFWDYSLPEAILKFRQGFGRLIRSREDHGIVVVLDNRIIKTSYGKMFLDSLPPCRRQVF